MAYIIRITIVFCILMSLVNYVYSQAPEIEKSEIIESIQGKRFYIHEVKQGHTVFSICKVYEISQAELAHENPEIFEGLQLGQKLRIPIKLGSPLKRDNEVVHKVEKGETLYALSKKYDVAIADIEKWNPEIRDGLKKGMEIRIIKKEIIKPSPILKTDVISTNDNSHVVLEKQTLYGISRMYNTTVTVLEELNPGISPANLKPGDVLKLPTKEDIEKLDSLEDITVIENSKQQIHIPDTSKSETENLINPLILFPSFLTQESEEYNETSTQTDISEFKECVELTAKKTVNAALFLPFSDDKRSIDKEEEEIEKNPNLSPSSKPFVEYYSGFIIALEELKNKGINVNLQVYDTKRDSSIIKEIIDSQNLDDCDIIFGPVYNETFKPLADYAKEKNIWIVFPINSNNPTINNNNKVIQINPRLESQMNQKVKYLVSQTNRNYIVLHNNTNEEKTIINLYKNELKNSFIKANPNKTISYSEVIFNSNNPSLIQNNLKKDTNNIIIIPSTNQVHVLDMLNRINLFYRDYLITVSTMPQWKRFERNIEFEHLFNMNASTFEPFYIDFNKSSVRFFEGLYNLHFKQPPSRFSFLGYDTGLFFLSIIAKYGNNFEGCINDFQVESLITNFYFSKTNELRGFENIGINILKCINIDNKEYDYKPVAIIKDDIEILYPVIESETE